MKNVQFRKTFKQIIYWSILCTNCIHPTVMMAIYFHPVVCHSCIKCKSCLTMWWPCQSQLSYLLPWKMRIYITAGLSPSVVKQINLNLFFEVGALSYHFDSNAPRNRYPPARPSQLFGDDSTSIMSRKKNIDYRHVYRFAGRKLFLFVLLFILYQFS